MAPNLCTRRAAMSMRAETALTRRPADGTLSIWRRRGQAARRPDRDEPRLPAVPGALRRRARALAVRRPRPLRAGPPAARRPGAVARRGLLLSQRALLPRQARLRARVRGATACPARRL